MKKEELANYVMKRNEALLYHRIGQLNLTVKDRFEKTFDFRKVFQKINDILPEHFLDLIDMIYIGQFDFLNNREVNASYMDGAIYITNVQDNEQDLLDDVVHETAHAIEEKYGSELYSDRAIEQNFIGKRHRLQRIIKYQGHNIEEHDFDETSYNQEFDNFLYKEVGYEKLNSLSTGLFLAPYSMTSLREYFARGFEEYYLGNRDYLKTVCPYIYNKLVLLEDNNYNEVERYET